MRVGPVEAEATRRAAMRAVSMRMAATGTAPIRRKPAAAASIEKAAMEVATMGAEIWPGGSRLRYESPVRWVRG
jgi:hypothetical protein